MNIDIPPPKVFISYSWDSQNYQDCVLSLAERLRSEGVDCNIDQYETSPEEHWPRWMENQIEWADFVLVACTEQYNRRFKGREDTGKGKGVTWEGSIITQQLYDNHGKNIKFIPVIFSLDGANFIPTPLRGANRYLLDDDYEKLYRYLTNQPLTPKPELGKRKSLNPRERKWNYKEKVIQNSGSKASPEVKEKGTPEMSSKSVVGLILVADVLNFSSIERGIDQSKVINNLWQFLRDYSLLRKYPDSVIDGVLDRVIVTLPGADHQEALDFASELIRFMKNSELPVDMRIGVHEGRFQQISKPGDTGTLLVGSGPNACARIADIGDAGHIIVSEDFTKSWQREQGNDVYQFLTPFEPDKPIEFFRGRGVRKHKQQIRVYSSPRVGEVRVPERLALLSDAEQQLWHVLKEVDEVLIELLQEEDDSLEWKKIRPRLSIFAPDPSQKKSVLAATEFRYIRELDPIDRSVGKGGTVYKLEGLGQGPAGRAFCLRSPQVLYNLPDFHQSPEEYIDILKKEWNVSEDIVKSFGRYARAFVTFPFMLSEDREPEGVICIDTLHCLRFDSLAEEKSKLVLQGMTESLMATYSLLVAALWRLRV